MYLRGRKCDNEEILKSENKKMRRYGRYEGDIFYRAEIPESTLYLYSYVKKYIFSIKYFSYKSFNIKVLIYIEVFKFNDNLFGPSIIVIFLSKNTRKFI